MNIVDYILIALMVGILFACGLFIRSSRKKGKKCIGCPDSCACSSGNCGGGCNGCNQK